MIIAKIIRLATILQLFYDFTNKSRPETNAKQKVTGKTFFREP